jgi:hypothetical protein
MASIHSTTSSLCVALSISDHSLISDMHAKHGHHLLRHLLHVHRRAVVTTVTSSAVRLRTIMVKITA